MVEQFLHSSVSGLHSSRKNKNKCLHRIRFLPHLKGSGLSLGCFNSDCRTQAGSVKRALPTRVTEKQKMRTIKTHCLFSERLWIGEELPASSQPPVCLWAVQRVQQMSRCRLSLPSQSQWATSAWQSLSETRRPTSSLTLPVWLFLETRRGRNQKGNLLVGEVMGGKKNPQTYQDHRSPSPSSSPPPTPCR